MNIIFDLNNSNAMKIKDHQKSISNRLNKLAQAKEKLQEEMIKWEIDGGMTNFQNIDEIFDSKLDTLKKNTSQVEKLIQSRLKTIEKYSNKLKEKEFNQNELQAEIKRSSKIKQPTEATYQAKQAKFKEAFLVSKIELKTNKPVPNSFRRQIVKINNEITHINNALVDMRELGDEITKDYNTARLNAFKDAYQQKIMSQSQSIVEVIAGFNIFDVGNMALKNLNGFTDAPSYHHINCLGRTAFC